MSAPSQPQTVPTNVLLIRWLNYSCKNNVDISLKIAVCQILLANLGLQPLSSNSSSNPPHLYPHPSLSSGSSHTFPHPRFFISPSHFLHSFMSQAATQANSERPNGPQINSSGLPIDLESQRHLPEITTWEKHMTIQAKKKE